VEITTIIQVADWSIPFMRVAVITETQITFRFAGLDMAGSCKNFELEPTKSMSICLIMWLDI
jgi:hypothetical protein